MRTPRDDSMKPEKLDRLWQFDETIRVLRDRIATMVLIEGHDQADILLCLQPPVTLKDIR
jgi:hypothetical protein